MTQKTIEQLLADLHHDLAKKLTDKLDSNEVTAAELNVIRQFLKDNHITDTPRQGSSFGDLAAKAAEYDEDEFDNYTPTH
ncbi:hypothetical protein [Zooshikella sp. RANM57]|uniref:hypothetical protein n=1 Tax=Zooshikella sp. RANM57 TaxID=3425863 RepID=UPI003D6E0864